MNALPVTDAWLEPYLDLTAIGAVGTALLDQRPAFVASADGGAMLWANVAGLALFRARDMAELAGRRFADADPLRVQLGRLSRLLPADRSRWEALAFRLGPWPAACRRLNLADGVRAVLVVGSAPMERPESLRARAQDIAAALADDRRAVAIIDRTGRVIGEAGAVDTAVVGALRGAASEHVKRPPRRTVDAGTGTVDIVGFAVDGQWLTLAAISTDGVGTTAAPRGSSPGVIPTGSAALAPQPAAETAPSQPTVRTTTAAVPPMPPAEPASELPAAAPPSAPVPADAPERLSGTEADAFRRIREALGRSEPRIHVPPADPPPPAGATTAGTAGAPLPSQPPSRDQPPAPSAAPAPAARPLDQALLDRLPVGIVIFRDSRTLLANQPLLDLLGFGSVTEFDLAGGVDQIFADGTRMWVAGDFDDRDGRLAGRRRDGTTFPAEARLNTVMFGGETAFMMSVLPRAPAAETPPEPPTPPNATSAERRIHDLETILNTATDGVLVVDRHGTIESMNRAAEALFAVESADMKGRSFAELFAEESRKTALDYLDGLAANGVQSVLNDGREVIGKVPNGGLIPLNMTMGRIGDSGRFCAVLRDITHWKTVEEELTAARREAEAANTQKSEFLAKISHEIRTPLNAIIGFSEIMMEQRFGPIGNDRYRAYLNDIHVSGAHLMSLINDLLDLSKIEAGKVDLSFESVAVNAVIQETVALMQPLANRERIIIRTSLSTDLPGVVADQRSFRQILLNLLSNAIKFTRSGGQVIVSTLLETSGEVVVRIRDTGIGMSAKDIETAMKPFEQVAKSQGDRDKGTGLGLPLTKAMVEANRATFAIESAPNQGTLVRIVFPTTRVLAG